ncbi:PepSY-associated TM helix domain-containing protein [Methylomonas sp. OY6]|uniref:PepSY-associated TM helix domain-containing protein n=1 Tax=Methylomonas defluvii TaxID=3045149 RepID=A0ABU4UE89_9GAMM|nr:PepSY-associated TM helix domain-containing protein [Methylomonas sp. OY6]MDX8127786.1 PepSY-associated TM helix domain-containing protein [Methylomonas sp. OY6]
MKNSVVSYPSFKSGRKIWLQAHLYLGLFAGALLVLISLTGSLIVFGGQIDTWLNVELMRVDRPSENMPVKALSVILKAAEFVLPETGMIREVKFPRHPDAVFSILYHIPPSPDSYQIFVNPYTAEILGQRLWGAFDWCCSWHGPLMAMIYRFHDSFWLGKIGAMATGVIGVLMLISMISGIVLWWPRSGKLKAALAVKPKSSSERLTYDLHKVFGIYPAVVLLMLLFTGAYLSFHGSFPKQVNTLVGLLSSITIAPDFSNHTSHVDQDPISMDKVLEIANSVIPDGKIDFILLNNTGNGIVKVFKHGPDELMESITRRMVAIDLKSGEVLYTNYGNNNTAGDIFDEWQLSLHSGEAFGLIGQVIVFTMGIVPLVLYITGVLRWSQKLKVKRLITKKI